MRFASTGFSKEEIKFVLRILNDPKAWGVPFQHVEATKNHEIVIHKLSKSKINALFPNEKHLHGLSVCDSRENPIRIYFSAENWDSVPLASGYTDIMRYRTYLVLHEFGHALGHGHESCPSPNTPAPVMMQQTKGTGECYPDPWVKKLF